LPGHADAFVAKVREATRIVGEALDNASNVHATAVEYQLEAMLVARQSGGHPQSSLAEYEQRAMIEIEQRTAKTSVEAAFHDLKALREEMEIQHQLSEKEQDELKERIMIDLQKCEAEMELLASGASLGHLPDALVGTLIDVFERGLIDQSSWSNGLSPMHVATQLGRRDVIEYLLMVQGGRELLDARDHEGRTPLYHAQRHNQKVLEHWFRDVAGVTAPMHKLDQRPSVSGIPAQYLQLLSQIESTGWNSVNWKNGYTMLHWAASKGHADLCRYLVDLDANVNMQDKQMRTPLAIARNAGHGQVVSALEDLKRRPSTPSRLQSMTGSRASETF